jgi:PAS domain S-box-containing protein
VAYWCIAVTWILLSDRALVILVPDPATASLLQTYKGWFFVSVTALLLYVTLRGQLSRWEHEAIARREAETALRRSEERFQLAMQGSNDGLWDWNLRTNEVYFSPRWKAMLGYAEDELANYFTTITDLIHPDDRERKTQLISEFLNGRVPRFEIEFRMHHKDGQVVYILSRAMLIRDEAGAPVRLVGTQVDITERKKAEAAIQASLQEKEVLLKEIHHRVKNNLQVISSLLSIQARGVKDEDLQTVFRESQYRVRAMAIVHEKLYHANNLAAIDFGEYLVTVTHELLQTYGKSGVEMRLEADPVPLEIDIAIPCGLIVNELVTNALKHAFPDGRKGWIVVSLHRCGDHAVELGVSDSGIGIPPHINFGESTSMGMTVVRSLTDQISGTLALVRTEGTAVSIRFSV